VSHNRGSSVSVVEAPKIPVPVPTQPMPQPTPAVPIVPPSAIVKELTEKLEAEKTRHQQELAAQETKHRKEFQTLQQMLLDFSARLDEGLRARQLQVNELQQAAVEIATTIAARIMHREVTSGNFPIELMVRDMVNELGTQAPLTIYFNPTDLASLRERLDLGDLLPDYGEVLKIAEDANLARASCRLETPETMLLGELGGQLQTIRDELLRSLGHAGS
jgi:flagellar biosynthesis/type III secretory pathway protein FliH